MSILPPKAVSVDANGAPDDFRPAPGWYGEVLQGGYTRLALSLPAEQVEAVHRDLVAALRPPLGLRYVQLTDRRSGQLAKPRDHVALELHPDVLLAALGELRGLVYHDGRHQLWVRGAGQEQVVLEEIGMIYVYPDDPSFRDVLRSHGLPEGRIPTMAERDYVRVNFLASADAEERALIEGLGMRPWAG